MERLTDYTNALTTLTYFINTKLVSEIVSYPETENKEPNKFFYTFLLKTNNALDTCSLLLHNYFDRPHHVDSLAIVQRSIVTDCVIYRFLLHKSQANDEDLVSNISSIYFDHVDFTVRGLKKCFESIYDWPRQKVDEEIAAIMCARPNYYDSNGKIKVTPFSTSVRSILTEMAEKRSPGQKSDLQMLYHHYDVLSKYEHLGEFSFQLVHRQYSESTRYKYLYEILDAINSSIIPTVISVVGIWPDLADKNMKEFNVLFKELLDAATRLYEIDDKDKS